MKIAYRYKIYKNLKGFKQHEVFENGLVLADHAKLKNAIYIRINDWLIFGGECNGNLTKLESAKNWTKDFIDSWLSNLKTNECPVYADDLRKTPFNLQ